MRARSLIVRGFVALNTKTKEVYMLSLDSASLLPLN
jgi:hypothetical protein